MQFSTGVFQSLCDIVDNKSPTLGVHKTAKSIILDGRLGLVFVVFDQSKGFVL